MRRLEAEAFSGPVIELVHGEFDIAPGDFAEGHFLREELSDEAIHILVSPALPRGVGTSEVEVSAEFAGDPLVLSELPAVVGRQGMNTGGKRRQQGDDGIRDRPRRLERHMGHQRVAGLPFVERDQCLLLAGADHQVSFPITKASERIDNGWALVNRHLIGDGAASLVTSVAFPPLFLAA